jgi:hypothetical protein
LERFLKVRNHLYGLCFFKQENLDESIGEKLNGGGASDDQGEESSSGTGTEHESTGSETQESKPAMGFWRQLTLFG